MYLLLNIGNQTKVLYKFCFFYPVITIIFGYPKSDGPHFRISEIGWSPFSDIRNRMNITFGYPNSDGPHFRYPNSEGHYFRISKLGWKLFLDIRIRMNIIFGYTNLAEHYFWISEFGYTLFLGCPISDEDYIWKFEFGWFLFSDTSTRIVLITDVQTRFE